MYFSCVLDVCVRKNNQRGASHLKKLFSSVNSYQPLDSTKQTVKIASSTSCCLLLQLQTASLPPASAARGPQRFAHTRHTALPPSTAHRRAAGHPSSPDADGDFPRRPCTTAVMPPPPPLPSGELLRPSKNRLTQNRSRSTDDI